jgi:hypothetical protein
MQFSETEFMRPLDDSQGSCSPIFGPAVPKVPYATVPITLLDKAQSSKEHKGKAKRAFKLWAR